MKKIYTIDFLRIAFTLIVILKHYSPVEFKEIIPLLQGGVRADLFFILSGFFLGHSALKYKNSNFSYLEYIRTRWRRLIPPMLIVMAIVFLIMQFRPLYFLGYASLLYAFAPNVLVPDFTPMWYVGSLFWTQIFMFALLYYMPIRRALKTISIISVCGLGFMYATNTYGAWWIIYGFISGGILRGLVGVGIGILLYHINKKLSFQHSNSTLWTVAEIIGYTALFYLLLYVPTSAPTHCAVLILFCALMISAIHSLGRISQTMNAMPGIDKIAKHCYIAYISQGLIGPLVLNQVNRIHGPWQLTVILLIITPFVVAAIYDKIKQQTLSVIRTIKK